MSKKKIVSLLTAGALATGIVGGTLAWFTSSDNVTNKFTTGVENVNDKDNNGLDIFEKFTPEEAKNLTPGTTVTKKVQVRNEASYSQFIRVKLTPVWTAPETLKGKNDNLDLTLNTNAISTTPTEGKWYLDSYGYYYFIGIVDSNKFTPLLLDSVTLNEQAGNDYKGGAFDVKVEADSIQSNNNAYENWDIKDDVVKKALGKCTENKGEDDAAGTTETDKAVYPDTVATGETTEF